MIQTETIPVYGMMCEHCVKAVTLALQDIDGVQGVQVLIEANSATVTFDDEAASLEKFQEAIIEEGYSLGGLLQPEALFPEAPVPLSIKAGANTPAADTVISHFAIQGMSCVNCSAAIEKSFRGFPGISRATVRLAIEKLTVEHVPSIPRRILRQVRDAGYDASPTCWPEWCNSARGEVPLSIRPQPDRAAGRVHVHHALRPCGHQLCNVCSCNARADRFGPTLL